MSVALTLWTVAVAVIFGAIVWWAWSGARKQAFEEAARIPLEEERLREENGEAHSNG